MVHGKQSSAQQIQLGPGRGDAPLCVCWLLAGVEQEVGSHRVRILDD